MSRTVSPSRPRSRWRSLVAGLSAALLLGAGVAPAQADTIVIWDGSTAEFNLTIESTGDDPFYTVQVTNLTPETQYLGFGADLLEPGVTAYLWEEEWQLFKDVGQYVILPGETYIFSALPDWPGTTYSFFRSINATPVLIGEYVNAGRHLPFDLGVDGQGDLTTLQVGYPVTARPGVARAEELLRVEAALGANWSLPTAEVWIGRNVDYSLEQNSLLSRGLDGLSPEVSAITDGMTLLGLLPVSGDAVAGGVQLPSGLEPGEYRIFVGDGATNLWPAGPLLDVFAQGLVPSVTIEAGAPRGTTQPGTAVPVAPLDQFGTTPVTFVFNEVTAGGTTSVTTSTSGPASTAFTLLGGANAVYYDLSTTAGFSGNVTVCLNYDPTGLSEVQRSAIALFHFSGGVWRNITTTRTSGQVCGVTDSFSPFALGIPVLQYAFQGFLNPVSNTKLNQEFAGSIIPIRFRLGGDQGLNVIASGSPTSGVSACNVGAVAPTRQATVSAVTPALTYAKATKTYWYFWKTNKSWAGTCRQFTLTLADGSVHTASFKFTKLTFGSLPRSVIKAF